MQEAAFTYFPFETRLPTDSSLHYLDWRELFAFAVPTAAPPHTTCSHCQHNLKLKRTIRNVFEEGKNNICYLYQSYLQEGHCLTARARLGLWAWAALRASTGGSAAQRSWAPPRAASSAQGQGTWLELPLAESSCSGQGTVAGGPFVPRHPGQSSRGCQGAACRETKDAPTLVPSPLLLLPMAGVALSSCHTVIFTQVNLTQVIFTRVFFTQQTKPRCRNVASRPKQCRDPSHCHLWQDTKYLTRESKRDILLLELGRGIYNWANFMWHWLSICFGPSVQYKKALFCSHLHYDLIYPNAAACFKSRIILVLPAWIIVIDHSNFNKPCCLPNGLGACTHLPSPLFHILIHLFIKDFDVAAALLRYYCAPPK